MRSRGWQEEGDATSHGDGSLWLEEFTCLASCTLGGQLAFIGLVLDVLKRYLHEL